MSLIEVRSAIDAIDDEIIKLLARRQPLVLKAATHKTDARAVRAADRRAAMMDRLAHSADAAGLSRSVVTAVWTAMIDAFIQLELDEHKRLSADDGTGSSAIGERRGTSGHLG
ncbi:chorismate mutase [Nocardioides sp. Y6]|uniref:Chorismate mutase n=1 Tax=Nocardioides malaquae TaxID=2773426 RepID=A0ABR9RSX5_9ACTN|nr:chorismate mutase [Nocardioides malaquae]MBE7324485.1 chorismate mutase [Nocardioides malaquae]